MINSSLMETIETPYSEPFEERIDILFRELELATKWRRPSVLLAVYSSEYVHTDADVALESRLHSLGQSAYHINIKNPVCADVSLQISELANLDNVVFFVEGLRWGAGQDKCFVYASLNDHREFFIENQIRVVIWLTENEAMDLAHHAPDYWAFRHRMIEFVDSPKPNQIPSDALETAWQETGETPDTADLDEKINLRNRLLTDLSEGDESTKARANLLLTLGMLYWRKGDFEKATQFINNALEQAASLEDNRFEALCFNAIALIQSDLGKLERAIQAFNNAIKLAPEQISPWNNLGNLHRKLKQYTEALDSFQKAIGQNASDARGWNGLGDVYHETGCNADAVSAYRKAIEFSPANVHSWTGLGNAFLEEGQLEEAEKAHQKAIEIDRDAVNSWLGLGNIHRMKGNIEHASVAFQTALELEPKNAEAWNKLGDLFYTTGAYDQAMRSYQKGIEFNQNSCQSYRNLASIYTQRGQYLEAIPLLMKVISLSDDSKDTANIWNQLADVYKRVNEIDNANEAYSKADMLDPLAAPHNVGSSEIKSDSQGTTSKDKSSQPASQPDNEAIFKEADSSKSSGSISAKPPEKSLSPGEIETTSIDPEAEYVTWLDGLASVQSALALYEETGGNASRINDNGQINKTETGAEKQSALPTGTKMNSTYSVEGYFFETFDDREIMMEAEKGVPGNTSSQAPTVEGDDKDRTQVTIDEKNAQIWNELGNIYYNTGAFDEAMHAFEMAIVLDPSYGWSYNNLASIYFHQKRYADAVPLYQKGLQLMEDQKDKALLWNRLGDTFRRLNDHRQAVSAYRKAMDLNPDNVSLLTRARLSLLGNLRL
jgi:tetratricopeptide (TPR) repeat protein